MAESSSDVEKIIDKQAMIRRQIEKKDIFKKTDTDKEFRPKMQSFKVFKKEFTEFTDGGRFVFKIIAVQPKKYRIGIAFKSTPYLIIGVLPRQFSPHIKRQYYRSVTYLANVLVKIAKDRGWKEFNDE